MVNELFRRGADVVYNAIADVHVSGHACQEELKIILSLVKPQIFYAGPRRMSSSSHARQPGPDLRHRQQEYNYRRPGFGESSLTAERLFRLRLSRLEGFWWTAMVSGCRRRRSARKEGLSEDGIIVAETVMNRDLRPLFLDLILFQEVSFLPRRRKISTRA